MAASLGLPLLLLLCCTQLTRCEFVREFEISEGVAVGTSVGLIGESSPKPPPPPYLIVSVAGSAVESDLNIDQSTGEIRTKVVLDREVRSQYSLMAIPQRGENIRVMIKVLDENDNAPTFPIKMMHIEFPENTPQDVKRTLHPARDNDLGLFNTLKYDIVSGNTNNAFRLSYHRERDGVLYLDLQINGFLDRETTAFYSLVIEALDGGSPPLKGTMLVNITIQDVNDNQPIFNQSRYFATVPENATVGRSVLQVFATDTDSGDNGEITYSINRRQSDRENMFSIDPKTGVISVNRPLDFESKDVHELVVVARDNGAQPLETTAFVSIRVTDVNDNQPTINLIFLSDDATPKISEDAQPGEFVARISVNDPDSKEEYPNVTVALEGGEGHFGLTTRDNIIYLVIVSLPLDRELKPNYTLVVTATDQGSPPLHASRSFDLLVTDTNDNAPQFDQTVYSANVLEVADPGTSVFQLSAADRDEGNNSVVTYSIKDSRDTQSDWFEIDSRTGLITTRSHVDCETNPFPQLVVVATDSGNPPLSSSATVDITIRDVNDNEPIFDQSFYNVSVREDQSIGDCILKVSATDPDCGENAKVNYTIAEELGRTSKFKVTATTGEICVGSSLDHEVRSSYEFPVLATDRGGLSTTAMVKIQLVDVNDNHPIFYPRVYNVSLRETETSSDLPVVVVAATDRDSGVFGRVRYSIVSGNELNYFRINKRTGEIYLRRSLSSNTYPLHRLNISATDGGGLIAIRPGEVSVSVLDSSHKPPVFVKPLYSFSVAEDAPFGTTLGYVNVTSSSGVMNAVRYSISSGDPNGYFTIGSTSAEITVNERLDHETHPFILLHLQAMSGDPPSYGHCQVNVTILDVNDNKPEFDANFVKISVPENAELGTPIYIAHASDHDSGNNGTIQYGLEQGPKHVFKVGRRDGILSLVRQLDFESEQQYSLVIRAHDLGSPPLSSSISIMVEVQDVNDNVPVFEKQSYRVNVIESLPANTQFLQVQASDRDTGNNARLTYRLQESDTFSVFPNSGSVYLRKPLDREKKDKYTLKVISTDNGSPMKSASASITVVVLDANDNGPVFTQTSYEFSVQENSERGVYVGTLAATDEDLGNNASVRFSLIPSNGSFQVHPITGDVTTRGRLDREVRSMYELVGVARDEGTPPREVKVRVTIHILDVNDNPPEIMEPREATVSVREEQPAGTEVTRVKAVDRDEGENALVYFSFIEGDDQAALDKFTIDASTGVIRTRMALDHEDRSMYQVTVRAQDGGANALFTLAQLHIEVLDLNDNRPTFPASSRTFKVKEGVEAGTEIGSVVAVDRDDGENGRVTYTIVSGNTYGTFEMDRTSGTLITTREVDYEMATEYPLQIKAVDNSATNPQSSIINVKIQVIDINDQQPMFPQDPVLFSVSENTPVGSVVWNLTATDLDSGANGIIAYSLSMQSPKQMFSLNANTGALSVSEPLDYEDHAEYTIVVTATDQAEDVNDRHSTSVTAQILIEDFNDNIPQFVSPSTLSVMEDEPVGHSILHVIAVDADSRDNGRISYSINAGNEKNTFDLDYDTGILSLAKALDRESTSYYVLNVTAKDHGRPSHAVTQMIRINVEDVNDSPPKFLKSVYEARVLENAPPGQRLLQVQAEDKDLGPNGNLSYLIPEGIADGCFKIDSKSGHVTVNCQLDRETHSSYTVPVYVSDGATPPLYDTAVLLVTVMDVNDHVPLMDDSCYPLYVPENSDMAVIHTVKATDMDAGPNAQIQYSIIEGNVDNMFSIDIHTGRLSCGYLDREKTSKYNLVIMAADSGQPSLSATCNITIRVLDQNDNDPHFSMRRYTAHIPEDVPVDTAVLTVVATDRDEGNNAKVTYALSNETQWLFKIDNETGIIRTAGMLDREKRSVFKFEVSAHDGGYYAAGSDKAIVEVMIGDVNDNAPTFSKYPFSATIRPYRQQILTVQANDLDEGLNSQIVYSFVQQTNREKFQIDSSTGVVSTVSSLGMESGHLYHLEVLATDKGNPPQSATGLVEIRVDGKETPSLHFQNDTYIVRLLENSPLGTEIVQVKATISDGRRRRISYSFGNRNDADTFEMNSNIGLIRVRDPSALDYERSPELRLIVVAQADDLYGYCTVIILLVDHNDNSPRFTQTGYTSTVWEGNNKGEFVMQVSATDADQGKNAHIMYHIVDGNHDNAFIIEPAFSGIVKTNIVLDREIRDFYRLTILATDEGIPQHTGTCTLTVNIVDVNDNQPTFPPPSVVTISEGSAVGSVVTTITANDVDTNPALTYTFTEGGNPGQIFSIDRFSGKITLAQPLDREKVPSYRLKVQASDTAHVAETEVTIKVIDENDNPPIFSEQSYSVTIPELTEAGRAVVTVEASDQDIGQNASIRFSLATNTHSFYIHPSSGVLYANQSLRYSADQPVMHLVIVAQDQGSPPLSSMAAVRVQLMDINNNSPTFSQRLYTAEVPEDARRGHTVLQVSASDPDDYRDNQNIDYSIIEGNDRHVFRIASTTGEVILVSKVDREVVSQYKLVVMAADRGKPRRNGTAQVNIIITDTNDHPPQFNQSEYQAQVSELQPPGTVILKVLATDKDAGENAEIRYDITSGNDNGVFQLDPYTGIITLKSKLNYDKVSEYRFIVRASDAHATNPLSAIATVRVKVQDENDNAPHFPVLLYHEFVPENSPVGTSVFTSHATDLDRGIYGKLNYSITENSGQDNFVINYETGQVNTATVFDYEVENRYYFTIRASDIGGQFATVQVQVDIESRDEFPPEFTEPSYHFTVPGDSPVGYTAGRVRAVDKDKGPDGRIFYQLKNSHPHFKINKTTGDIIVKKMLSPEGFRKKRESLVVKGSSGRPDSQTSIVVVELTVDSSLQSAGSAATSAHNGSGLASWALGLVIALSILALVLAGAIIYLRRRSKRTGKPALAADHFDPSFDTIDIRTPTSPPGDLSQFPPRYNDLPPYDPTDRATGAHGHQSELSEQSHSASSGRGSAEDGEDVEDEEIRMINEGPLMQQKMRERLGIPDSGIHDDDNMSDVSVHNTQEYLARLGIDTTRSESNKGSQSNMTHMFEDEGGGGPPDSMDISNLIYAKLSEVGSDDTLLEGARAFGFGEEGQPSMTGSLSSIVHSEEELTGSYNWDYLLDWGPQYQPLAHVFHEIARLKDDSAPSSSSFNVPKKTLNPQVKTVPPPLLTNVAPRSIAPVARTSQMPSLPRSPISHEGNLPAMSPSFSPSLSPLATRSPSISPLMAGGPSVTGRMMPHRQIIAPPPSSGSETELRI